MSEDHHITPLTEILSDLSESELRANYLEFVPVNDCTSQNEGLPFGGSKRGRPVTKPDRERISAEFDEGLDGQNFRNAQSSGELLHNATPPSHVIQQEKSEHRFLVFLFAQGKSAKTIFLELGGEWDEELGRPVAGTGQWSYSRLIQIRKQTWFQKALISYLEECGRDVITARLEAECGASIDTVVELRDNKQAPPAVRLNAAKDILDRFLGKATQKVEVTQSKSVSDYESELEEIKREEESLTNELRHLNPGLLQAP